MDKIEVTNKFNLKHVLKAKVNTTCLSLILSLTVISCSGQNNLSVSNVSDSQITNTFKVSDKGADISFKINLSLISSSPLLANGVTVPTSGGVFSTKANANGIAPKTAADVDHYVVYLVKDNSTSSYPLNGDPLNASNIVSGPFTISNDGSVLVKFTGVNTLATGAYYVAVKAQDASNVDLIRVNNGSGTAWTGTTLTTHAGKVAVSTGAGITVNSSYAVNTTTPLSVLANLTNAIGARIDSNIVINNGIIPANNSTANNINRTSIITTIAGTGAFGYSGDGGQATSAQLNYPEGSIALDSSGNIYIADNGNHRIRKVTASTGIITTIAGTGTAGYSGDGGQATSAQINAPESLLIDEFDNVYIADTINNRIRKVTASTGIITTVAGTTIGYSGDGGQATSAQLNKPYGLALDSSNNIYIADSYNHRIRKVTASTGIITTIAGTGAFGYSGDGGQATSAQLNRLYGVATDSSGNVYIADYNNSRIRKVTASTGIITTVAGTGAFGYSGDGGQATSAQLNRPFGVATDSLGNVYIADYDNHRIRKIAVSTGIITTIAGTGVNGGSGDGGQATSARLNRPSSLFLDPSGNLYITDSNNHRIRKIHR